jgi:hypothetical protein
VNPLQPWHDTKLKAGDRWDKEIRAELERMDVFLCLVSYQFLASDYIKAVELPRAMARHKNGEIEVVPVILYPMDLKRDCNFLSELNPLPEWGKTWQDFAKDGDWNEALPLIGKGIEQAIQKARLRSNCAAVRIYGRGENLFNVKELPELLATSRHIVHQTAFTNAA